MNYDFDEVINRYHTNSIKYDYTLRPGMPDGVIPLWIADMDFRIPPEVAAAIHKTAEHGIYGYTAPQEPYYTALSNWFSRRFGYPVKRQWVVKIPGVVFALTLAVRVFTREGDAVLIQRPVYYPFSELIIANNRKLVNNPLVYKNGKYQIDFEDFEAKITGHGVKLFILCSPHNPVGRVWLREELLRIGEICKRHGCLIVSDEIHCDFVFPEHKHILFPSLSPECADNCILCTAPSKTFNLAGLQTANIIIPNTGLRKQFKNELAKMGLDQMNTTGIVSCQAAYEYGENWLRQLLSYLRENLRFARNFLGEYLPQIHLVEPEGTYLVWLDFRNMKIAPHELSQFITCRARLRLDSGESFGEEGLGFQRINIACPKTILEQALTRLRNAFDGRE